MKTTNEETILGQQNMVNQENINVRENKQPKQESKKHSAWVDAGIGAGTGVAAGIIGTLLTSGTLPTTTEENNEVGEVVDDGLTTPVVTDGQIPIAHEVDDSMSFSEAFRVAHEEVGPGGVFEWHGQLYGTYTAAEWNSLSSEEQLEYSSHLRVVGTPDYASNVSHHENHVPDHQAEDVAVDTTDTNNTIDVSPADDDEIAVNTTGQTEDVEVEVLGVEYMQTEDGQEMAVGGMSVNGQEIYVLDADNDGIGDVAVMDINGNGQLDEDEILDLSENPVDMSSFETANSDLSGDVSPAEPDYLSMESI